LAVDALYLGVDPPGDRDDERKLSFWPRRAEGGFAVTVIDFRADPAKARSWSAATDAETKVRAFLVENLAKPDSARPATR